MGDRVCWVVAKEIYGRILAKYFLFNELYSRAEYCITKLFFLQTLGILLSEINYILTKVVSSLNIGEVRTKPYGILFFNIY